MPCKDVARSLHPRLLEMEVVSPHFKELLQAYSRHPPIMLMEVLSKLWTGLLVDEVTSSLQRHSSLSLSQHGYLPHHGTDTASLQLLNTLETAWDARRPLYGCSWDISKAFDSVSKPLIVLRWQRLGLPAEIAQWLVDQDDNGYTIIIVRTPHALAKLDVEGLEGLRKLSFNPERGTGQGDIHSHFTWLAGFDVLQPLHLVSGF